MKLRYHIATISFNPDLVDPEAKGCPVGLLFVGETGTDAVALLALGHRPRFADRLPTVMRSILDDFPALMVAQLDEMLKDQGSTSIDGIMEAFEDSLRNSFFVSDLKMNQYVDVPLETPDPAPEQALYAPVSGIAAARIAKDITPSHGVEQAYRHWPVSPSAGSGGSTRGSPGVGCCPATRGCSSRPSRKSWKC